MHRRLRRREVWGRVEDGAMRLNHFGRLVEECWRDLPNHHVGVELDAFMVMPNHVHAILFLTQAGFEAPYQAAFGPVPANSLSSVMGAFKAAVTRAVNRKRGAQTTVWQERFYERIIRAEEELDVIRRYVRKNPANWPQDRCHPQHPKFDLPWDGIAPDDV